MVLSLHHDLCSLLFKISGLGDFLITNTGWFNSCAFKLLWIQLLCVILTVLQLYLMDVVMGNQFLHLGRHIFNFQELSVALYTVFPIGKVKTIVVNRSQVLQLKLSPATPLTSVPVET